MYPILKRILDLSVALTLLIASSPLLLVVALLVRWRLGSPIIFRQERAGQFGYPFQILKFRSMTDAADRNGVPLPDEARLTAFGQFLRTCSLDELPQLLNILKGDISLVGPRPLYMRYIPRYSEEQRRRLLVPQGITGLAQVNGRNAISWEQKFEWDTRYVDAASFGLDIKILWLTLLHVFRRQGISQAGHATMTEYKGQEERADA